MQRNEALRGASKELRCAAWVLAVLLASAVLSGCGGRGGGTAFPECGLVLDIPAALEADGVSVDSYGSDRARYPMAVLSFSYLPAVDALYEEYGAMDAGQITEDTVREFRERLSGHSQPVAAVFTVPKSEWRRFRKSGFPEDAAILSTAELLGTKHGNAYLSVQFGNDTGAMSAEEEALFERCRVQILEVVRGARFIRVEAPAPDSRRTYRSVLPEQVPPLDSVDMTGAAVTEDLFYEADLTVLNIWGTFCGPCIQEMPELAAWAGTLPPDVQLVGIVCDVFSPDDASFADAHEILRQAGATFVNMIATETVAEFIAGVQFLPTTVLVDGTGRIVGDPIVGADVRKYRAAVEAWLEGARDAVQ